MKTITIIGGGAGGVLLAINLIKNAGEDPLELNLVEKSERLGRGVAYSAPNDFHLLNVPANKMGAFPDDVEHFYEWLRAGGHDFAANDFVPRRLYGVYLRDLFNRTAREKPAGVNLRLFNSEAVDVFAEENGARIRLDSGEDLTSEKVVLAFGNFAPPHPKTDDDAFTRAPNYFQNPWQPDLVEKIDRETDVLLIGTGLTMADAVLSLYHAGHAGKITAISTRGLLPAVHELGFVYPSFADELKGKTKISEMHKIVRRHAESAEAGNSDWRGVIDSLRPATQSLWQNLSVEEKARFMRHPRRVWEVSRHRVPPEVAARLEQMRAANQLNVVRGRIRRIETQPDGGFQVFYTSNGDEKSVSAGAIVNCTGSESNFARLDIPLVKNLLGKGYVQTDDLSLGLKASPEGRLINRDKRAPDVFYTLGTAMRGVLWETTAMPEIRSQARQTALLLLEKSNQTEI